jgi:hypothetical protein
LKVCQFTAARCEDWVIVVVLAFVLIEAVPAVTTPPVGRAVGAGCAAAGSESKVSAGSALLTSKADRQPRTTPSIVFGLVCACVAISHSSTVTSVNI